jgi:hypothetical protein
LKSFTYHQRCLKIISQLSLITPDSPSVLSVHAPSDFVRQLLMNIPAITLRCSDATTKMVLILIQSLLTDTTAPEASAVDNRPFRFEIVRRQGVYQLKSFHYHGHVSDRQSLAIQ